MGKNNIHFSHLQFANDALILGEWSLENAKNLFRLLRYFHMASGVTINFTKSKLYGIGVAKAEVYQPSMLPCYYLGLLIGAKMSKISSWIPIVEKFQNKLSSWKARTLSYGGRLTLIKSVLGNLGTYYFSIFKAPIKTITNLETLRRKFFWGGNVNEDKLSWIAWKKVCSKRKNGGLNIGSLLASNFAMLAKWWWRFRIEKDAYWQRIIRSIYGENGGLNSVNSTLLIR